MMDILPVIQVTQLLNLMCAILTPYIENNESVDKPLFEKYFVYAFAWSCAGMYENEDREKFHKYLEARNAPLPSISAQKM